MMYFIIILLFISPFVSATQYIVTGSDTKVTYINNTTGTTSFNYGASPVFRLSAGTGQIRSTLIAPIGTLDEIIPSSYKVDSAWLMIRDSSTIAAIDTIYCYAIRTGRSIWQEGALNGSNPGLGGDGATNAKYYGSEGEDLAWGTAGCQNTTSDRQSAFMDSAIIPVTIAQNDWVRFDLDTSEVQRWLSTEASAQGTTSGVKLQFSANSTVEMIFYSNDYATGASHPYFEIHAHPNTTEFARTIIKTGDRKPIVSLGKRPRVLKADYGN